MSEAVHQSVSLEMARLEAIAATYPEEMREDFLWLGAYCREECNRSLDVLEAQIRALGMETTKDTLSKIFRGRWQLSPSGEKLKHPIMGLAKFLALVAKLREESKLAALAGRIKFIETETWDIIKGYIDARRAPDRVNRFGLIIGPTGSQKTACYKEYARRNNHGTCVWLEAPHGPRLGDFITDLAERYGISVWRSQTFKMLQIEAAVNHRRTIIVDNIQRLYSSGAEASNQPIFSYLQKLQDKTGCTVILGATPEFYRKDFIAGIHRGYFEQFEGRCGGRHNFLVLASFADRSECMQIGAALGLQEAEKHGALLEKIAWQPGRIRILFDTLQSAKAVADACQKPFTVDFIEQELDGVELKEAA